MLLSIFTNKLYLLYQCVKVNNRFIFLKLIDFLGRFKCLRKFNIYLLENNPFSFSDIFVTKILDFLF